VAGFLLESEEVAATDNKWLAGVVSTANAGKRDNLSLTTAVSVRYD